MSREGQGARVEGASARGATGLQRDRPWRPGGTELAGRGGESSLLPALMANPWLMTNALLNNPLAFTQAMSREMDRLFSPSVGDTRLTAGRPSGEAARTSGLGRATHWAPQLEVRQRENDLVVYADLPGLKPEDIDIEIEDGVLTISGERQQHAEDRQGGVFRSERSYGAFSRSIALPEDVDEDQVEARFEHGVLEVTVPLPPRERQRARRVRIEAGGSEGTARRATAPGAGTQATSEAAPREAPGGGAATTSGGRPTSAG